jgi:hypothetical protein
MAALKHVIGPLAVVAASLLAGGCGIPDPYAKTTSTATKAAASPSTAVPSTSTAAPASTATPLGRDAALRRFVDAWMNWTPKNLTAQRQVLLELAAEPLRAQLRRDADQARRDELLRVTTASNSGRLVGTIEQPRGIVLVVTSEVGKTESQTEGQRGYHVYIAAGTDTPSGWKLNRWEPTA